MTVARPSELVVTSMLIRVKFTVTLQDMIRVVECTVLRKVHPEPEV